MGRILCLDYGERRTGVAISDETRTIAQSLGTLKHRNQDGLLTQVQRLIAEHSVDTIVLGLPLGRAGKPSARSQRVTAFGKRLEQATGLAVRYCSERYSTVQAQEVYTELHGKPFRSRGPGRKRPSPLDRIAATIILESYLESLTP